MASPNHLLKCCLFLAMMIMIVQAQTSRKLLDTHADKYTPISSYFNPPSMDSPQASLPSSHRSLGAEFYKRSPPPPHHHKKATIDESQTGI
ncbi:hypothetical protein EUTSA_v10005493mg [Eutrema salsugineum]|uniref:Uncharacterized protein n=2 Tax=Eutrema salsugineum TaxID=72664 RepID=V4KPV4_EUTSA|nr:hypothetical protein EUTSA_v10005493mg [Eutrema salsugineum]